MTYISNMARSKGDPKVLRSGPSSLGPPDRLARALGWFSLALGLTELLAPRRLTHTLGMEGSEGLVRAYGAREIGSGVLSLSIEKDLGLWSRVAGDGLDLATLMAGLRPDNPKRDNVVIAIAMVVGITALDVLGAVGVKARHRRQGGSREQYRDRSGFPQGLEKSRGAARDFRTPPDMRAAPALVHSVA
ncbi:MAG TPA: hypothetical protein VE650_21095 [Acetobacteraceae bacterium]|jgi:hypothetical protein|nr:hypothetical protein [Acetobacteraceae bacterium]